MPKMSETEDCMWWMESMHKIKTRNAKKKRERTVRLKPNGFMYFVSLRVCICTMPPATLPLIRLVIGVRSPNHSLRHTSLR